WSSCGLGVEAGVGDGRSINRPTFRRKIVSRPSSDGELAGGEGGIRTHGELAPTAVFKTAALNHSATSPRSAVDIACRAELCKARGEPSWPDAGFALASEVVRRAC